MLDRSVFFTSVPIVYNDPDPFGLEPANLTSCSSGKDNGAMKTMTRALPGSMNHGTTEQLVSNINNRRLQLGIDEEPSPLAVLRLSTTRRSFINIGGHGNEGLFETGAGQEDFFPAGMIYASSSNGMDALRKLKTRNTELVSIYSCSTGAGYAGAQLLFNLSKMWNVPVRARTGITYAISRGNKSWLDFENGSSWQLASPDMTAPPAVISKISLASASLSFGNINSDINANLGNVSHIQMVYFSSGQILQKTIGSDKVNKLLSVLFASQIFPNEGSIMGVVTSTLTFYFSDGSKPLNILIYCNSIALIREKQLSFYIANTAEQYMASV